MHTLSQTNTRTHRDAHVRTNTTIPSFTFPGALLQYKVTAHAQTKPNTHTHAYTASLPGTCTHVDCGCWVQRLVYSLC